MSAPGRPSPLTTHGHAAREQRCGGWTLTQAVYASESRYPPHSHERPYLCLVLAGGFREEHRGRTEVAEAGSVVVMPAGQAHTDLIAPGGARSFVLTFGDGHGELRPPGAWRVEQGGPVTRAMLRILSAARQGWLDEATVEEALLHAADTLAPPPRAATCTAVAGRAREYLAAHRDEPLLLGDVAEALGVDRAYLARAFRRAFGCTMGEYRRLLRLQRAMGMVAEGTPLARAAVAAGYADQSHLSRAFRGDLGVTAAAYRGLSASPA
ncbi:MAG TPA: AraC family transcriptional regulator [Longimicrobium sp.]|jgi:AraC family transcriptional regulator